MLHKNKTTNSRNHSIQEFMIIQIIILMTQRFHVFYIQPPNLIMKIFQQEKRMLQLSYLFASRRVIANPGKPPICDHW